MTKTKSITPADVAALLEPGMTVFIPGTGGESLLFAEILKDHPEACAGVRFVGVLIPGVNHTDYAGLHETARATAFFVTPANRDSYAAGKIDFLPMHYSAVTPYLRGQMSIDLALIQVAPARDGSHSVGIAADFVPSIVDVATTVVAHVNPAMPSPPDCPRIQAGDIDYVVEAEHPLLAYDLGKIPSRLNELGANIASLISDGDCVEIGLGKIQAAVLSPLYDRKNLRLHAGMICDPIMDLYAAGAFAARTGDRAPITTGVAVGSPELYAWVGENPDIAFRPVTHTHDVGVLGEIDNFVAINSAIEVDLLGQGNAEMIGAKQVSAGGGLVDFMRGARRSKGGRAVLALISATSDGKTSRIVPTFAQGTVVTCGRTDVDFVITENGVADLRNTTARARAKALIEVAAPQFREELAGSLG